MDAITAGNSELAIARAIHALRDNADYIPNGGQGGQLAGARQPDRGPRAFARDYGPTRTLPFMEPQGLRHGGSRNSTGDRSSARQGSLVGRAVLRFRAEMSSMCPGARVFYWCLVAASIIEIARVV